MLTLNNGHSHGPAGSPPPVGGWTRTAGSAAAACALTGLVLLSLHDHQQYATVPAPAISAALWAAFSVGAWLVLGTRTRHAVLLILLGGIAIQLAALSAPPRGSDDLYRYIWDGRVQAAGIDPYRYVPAAPQLDRLRDGFLWPPDAPYCVPPGGQRPGDAARQGPAWAPGCTRINRPTVHTIYPPVAQAYFVAVDELSPAGSGSLPIQAAAAFCAVATTVLLLAGLRAMGRDPRLAVLWAWCPVTGLEAGNNAHVDVLAIFLSAAALFTLARARGRRGVFGGGVLLGLAIAAKVTPVLIAPAALRRRFVTVTAAVGAATATVYLPHLIAVRGAVIGYLPGYLKEEGYDSGGRFQLLNLILPGHWAILGAVAVLAIVGLLVLYWADPSRPWRGAVVMTGTALAITTPPLPWYALLLVMLTAVDGRPEWLALAAARYLTPAGPWLHSERVAYALAVAIVSAASLARWLSQRRDDLADAGYFWRRPRRPAAVRWVSHGDPVRFGRANRAGTLVRPPISRFGDRP